MEFNCVNQSFQDNKTPIKTLDKGATSVHQQGNVLVEKMEASHLGCSQTSPCVSPPQAGLISIFLL